MIAQNSVEKKLISLKKLHKRFKRDITVEYIAEKLICCSKSDKNYKKKAKNYMKKSNINILGLRENNLTSKYITVEGDEIDIEITDVTPKTTPIIDILHTMRIKSRLFILEDNKVIGIVTRNDLLKTPGRILFCGLFDLLKMQFTYLIQCYYPNNSWQEKISPHRLKKAKDLLEIRKPKNKNLNLLNCLQFSDKIDLILKNPKLLEILGDIGIENKFEGETLIEHAQNLRNQLAHDQNIRRGTSWPNIIDTIEKIEKLSSKIEDYLKNYV